MSPAPVAQAFPSRPESVGAIRSAIAHFAAVSGVNEHKIEAIRTAVSEAATNAIVHGYGGSEGDLIVSAELSGGRLTIVIADNGHGMLPRRSTRGLGLGLPLISTLADHLDVISPTPSGGTEIRMSFTIEDQISEG